MWITIYGLFMNVEFKDLGYSKFGVDYDATVQRYEPKEVHTTVFPQISAGFGLKHDPMRLHVPELEFPLFPTVSKQNSAVMRECVIQNLVFIMQLGY